MTGKALYLLKVIIFFFYPLFTTLGAKNLIIKIDQLAESMDLASVQQILENGFLKGKQALQAVSMSLIEDLSTQHEAPILCMNPHLFENLLILKMGFEKLKINPQVQPFWEKLNTTKEKYLKHVQKIATLTTQEIVQYNNELIESNMDNFILRTDRIAPKMNKRETRQVPENSDIRSAFTYSFMLDSILQQWRLFEYREMNDSNPTNSTSKKAAYLLVPMTKDDKVSLESFGIDSKFFQEMSIADLENDIRNGRYTSAAKSKPSEFELRVLEIINNTMALAPYDNPWRIYVVGHGLPGLIVNLRYMFVTHGLLPILHKKNTDYVFFRSCYIGGGNRELIRSFMSDINPFSKASEQNSEQFKVLKQWLKKKNIMSPSNENFLPWLNSMIIVAGGITDSSTTGFVPYRLISSDKISDYLNDLLNSIDSVALSLLPFFPDQRLDRYFSSLADYLTSFKDTTSQLTRTSMRAETTSLKDVLKYFISGSDYQALYSVANTPQVRFPGYDQPFNVVQLNKFVQILRYVDMKALELKQLLKQPSRAPKKQALAKKIEAGLKGRKRILAARQRRGTESKDLKADIEKRENAVGALQSNVLEDHKDGESAIEVSDKKILIVCPQAVNVPITIKGPTLADIVPWRVGSDPYWFSKITVDANFEEAIQLLYPLFYPKTATSGRAILIDEFVCTNGTFCKVLIDKNASSVKYINQSGDAMMLRDKKQTSLSNSRSVSSGSDLELGKTYLMNAQKIKDDVASQENVSSNDSDELIPLLRKIIDIQENVLSDETVVIEMIKKSLMNGNSTIQAAGINLLTELCRYKGSGLDQSLKTLAQDTAIQYSSLDTYTNNIALYSAALGLLAALVDNNLAIDAATKALSESYQDKNPDLVNNQVELATSLVKIGKNIKESFIVAINSDSRGSLLSVFANNIHQLPNENDAQEIVTLIEKTIKDKKITFFSADSFNDSLITLLKGLIEKGWCVQEILQLVIRDGGLSKKLLVPIGRNISKVTNPEVVKSILQTSKETFNSVTVWTDQKLKSLKIIKEAQKHPNEECRTLAKDIFNELNKNKKSFQEDAFSEVDRWFF